MSMKQKDAVFAAITNVVGSFEGKVELSKEQKSAVNAIITQGILSGDVEYLKDDSDEKAVREYVPGLVSNWLRKDVRLNGGGKYAPKNPGSRAGQGDAQVKELRKLLAQQSDPGARAEIQEYINKRIAEIKPAKTVTIDMSALPAELQAKYSA